MDLLITLIGNAVVDFKFRGRLLADPLRTADEYGFHLTKGEEEMLETMFNQKTPKAWKLRSRSLRNSCTPGWKSIQQWGVQAGLAECLFTRRRSIVKGKKKSTKLPDEKNCHQPQEAHAGPLELQDPRGPADYALSAGI